MPKCINCGYEYKRFGHGKNDGFVLGCSRCYRRFSNDDVNMLLDKFWRM